MTSERFELGPRIGRGSAGDVHTARDKLTDDVVAVKLVDLEEAEDEVEDIQRCLLYTSPSPRDQRGSRMPSSA